MSGSPCLGRKRTPNGDWPAAKSATAKRLESLSTQSKGRPPVTARPMRGTNRGRGTLRLVALLAPGSLLSVSTGCAGETGVAAGSDGGAGVDATGQARTRQRRPLRGRSEEPHLGVEKPEKFELARPTQIDERSCIGNDDHTGSCASSSR